MRVAQKRDRRCAQAHVTTLLLCGNRCLSLIDLQVDQFPFSDRSAGETGG
jgi:hypothetical protein